ncbi:MAG: DUF4091 domain-containing protein [Clostridia bacterium]|nr:DUF4091 domain-containing protein [Clostridia bacterium]
MNDRFILKTVGAIEKIRKYEAPKTEERSGVCFANARYNFQVVFCGKDRLRDCEISVDGTLAPYATLRLVEDVPVKYTYNFDVNGDDDFVMGKEGGLYPDLLREFRENDLTVYPDQWTSCWVTVCGGERGLPVGEHALCFTVKNPDGELGRVEYTLKVVDETLPELDIFNANWLHYDCLAEWYDLEVFSKAYYEVLNEYIKNAVAHGVNTLLTPLFTPPLDTAVGTERPTVQLVGVKRTNGEYAFDFSRLDEFIDNALALGVEYIEFSHLYTQWGGLHAPKIVATTENGYEKIFGWETDSEGAEYVAFMQSFLPALVNYIERKGLQKRCYFHIFDEPQEKDLEKYTSLRRFVKGLIGELPVIDALSDPRFMELVDIPVVDSGCLKHFVGKCNKFGAYYFCGTSKNATNRFIVHPALRTRVLGYQAYLYPLAGFLHWGFNFWKTELSKHNIDPYFVNDAGGAFPAGDPFTVYPAEGKPLDSIRNEIVSDGWQDYRELLFVQGKVGREKILELFAKYGLRNVNDYSLLEADYTALRGEILSLVGIKA